jgi:hypothetical protein
MFAKAVQGMKPEEAVKWAEGELKKVYEALSPVVSAAASSPPSSPS